MRAHDRAVDVRRRHGARWRSESADHHLRRTRSAVEVEAAALSLRWDVVTRLLATRPGGEHTPQRACVVVKLTSSANTSRLCCTKCVVVPLVGIVCAVLRACFIDALHRADIDAGSILHVDAGFGEDRETGHASVPHVHR